MMFWYFWLATGFIMELVGATTDFPTLSSIIIPVLAQLPPAARVGFTLGFAITGAHLGFGLWHRF